MLGNTPMFRQYHEIKKDHQDEILFYRLGDFYEMFGEDATIASKILGLALTARDGGTTKVPMCGIPFHSAENYIYKLVNHGYKVAICEQIENPKETKGIVQRKVVRIITPGMFTDDISLQDDNNYIISISRNTEYGSIAIADVSTGHFVVSEQLKLTEILNEIERFQPVEIIYNENDLEISNILYALNFTKKVQINKHYAYAFEYSEAMMTLKNHFKVNDLMVFGLDRDVDNIFAIEAAGSLLNYVSMMQQSPPLNITKINMYRLTDSMVIDKSTIKNLELENQINLENENYSLFYILNQTKTAFGKRLLKEWLLHPLTKDNLIQNRLDATEELINSHSVRENLKKIFNDINDLERIVSRISFESANAKDLLSLKNSIRNIIKIPPYFTSFVSKNLHAISEKFDSLDDVYVFLEKSVYDDAPYSLRDGNLIKNGYNEEVDNLRKILNESDKWLDEFEKKEKEKTGIKNLKIGYNKIFGYFIDITKSNINKVPNTYIRKQTLANSERYITDELKQMEQTVIHAGEKLKNLEFELFSNIRKELKGYISRILSTCLHIAEVDIYISFAVVALENNYVKPIISKHGIEISGLRHPVVEKTLNDKIYKPNDILFNDDTQRFIILTGPNMGGKSTHCRSIALASIMMQIGSYVAAENAKLSVVDRVFARIGANDQLASGQSTFMVEMNEVANILNNATSKSLIILDEVGRGTSTFDGLSIAYAITKFINERIKAYTIFATHYHELTILGNENGIQNFSVAVEDDGKEITFLHDIVPGAADRSYGIHVAKMSGLPEDLLINAEEILSQLEKNKKLTKLQLNKDELKQKQKLYSYENLLKKISEEDINNLSVGDILNKFIMYIEEAKTQVNR